ncbi:chorismate mutase [Streptomyces racemochromogenes]|uniref:Chorismate mutase n=1 Tax=Streptomyces racemochromogenes TaxID=67353 RepID=A0ABW7PQ76_9ACTN
MSTIGTARITERKAHLASLDREIMELIHERNATCEQLRVLRRLAGLREFQLAHENEVLSQYHEALGRPGTAIALQLLALARTERGAAVRPVPERRVTPTAA